MLQAQLWIRAEEASHAVRRSGDYSVLQAQLWIRAEEANHGVNRSGDYSVLQAQLWIRAEEANHGVNRSGDYSVLQAQLWIGPQEMERRGEPNQGGRDQRGGAMLVLQPKTMSTCAPVWLLKLVQVLGQTTIFVGAPLVGSTS